MKSNKRSLFFIISGVLCMALGFSLFVYNKISAEKAFEASQQTVTILTEKLSEQKEKSDFPTDNYDRKMPEITIDGKKYIGVLEIKELNLKLPIASDLSYEMLDISPCLYSGTIYRKNMVIAAHNYEKHFGKINSLSLLSELIFTDTENNKYVFEVVNMESLLPGQVKEMKEKSDKNSWDMTLFTCDYSGNRRIAIRCKMKSK